MNTNEKDKVYLYVINQIWIQLVKAVAKLWHYYSYKSHLQCAWLCYVSILFYYGIDFEDLIAHIPEECSFYISL